MIPSYLKLYGEGRLEEIKEKLLERLKRCDLCPRR